jgi:MFS family permease
MREEHAEADETASPSKPHDPYFALRFRDFRLLSLGVFVGALGQQMLTIALGWELYARTHSALVLGGVGLAQVIPLIAFALPAGHVADRYSRKLVVLFSEAVVALASLGLAAISAAQGPILLIYVCLAAMGAATSFSSPASSALIGEVLPEEAYENASTWRSSTWQLSAVVGPAAGGFLVGLLHGATGVYVLNTVAAALYVLTLALLRTHPPAREPVEEQTIRSILEGVEFLRHTPVLLAAITLDLFAVLFGGAVTLLPIYARDILHVGPIGLGWLQTASSVGAIGMALVLTHRPPFGRAGRTLLVAVAGFGLATIVFGISHWFWLSLLMLAILGALDNISVVIRSTLVLTRTPDAMRGRVGAVNWLFIGTSNQLGGFESGLAAQLFGPVIAVVAGGVGTILVVGAVAAVWPQMRNLRRLSDV